MDIYIIKILSYSYTGKIKLITSILIEAIRWNPWLPPS